MEKDGEIFRQRIKVFEGDEERERGGKRVGKCSHPEMRNNSNRKVKRNDREDCENKLTQ